MFKKKTSFKSALRKAAEICGLALHEMQRLRAKLQRRRMGFIKMVLCPQGWISLEERLAAALLVWWRFGAWRQAHQLIPLIQELSERSGLLVTTS